MEAGAKTGIIGVDDKTLDFYREMNFVLPSDYPEGDADAGVAEEIEIDVEGLDLQVAAPYSPDNVWDLAGLQGLPITHGFIGYCVNGRIADLEQAARVLENRRVHPSVLLTVTPGSQRVYREALEKGYIRTFLDAGALVAPSTCGACAGIHMGVLGSNDVAISTTNRNFRGRMGHPESKVYLANPAVVAASAITGKITSPMEVGK